MSSNRRDARQVDGGVIIQFGRRQNFSLPPAARNRVDVGYFARQFGFPIQNLLSYPPSIYVKDQDEDHSRNSYERQTPGNIERKAEAAFSNQTSRRTNYRCRALSD